MMPKFMKNNEQLVHIGCEILVVLILAYYFNRKNSSLFKHIEDISSRLEEQEDEIETLKSQLGKLVEIVTQQRSHRSSMTPPSSPPMKPKSSVFTPDHVTQPGYSTMQPPVNRVVHSQPRPEPPVNRAVYSQPRPEPPVNRVVYSQARPEPPVNRAVYSQQPQPEPPVNRVVYSQPRPEPPHVDTVVYSQHPSPPGPPPGLSHGSMIPPELKRSSDHMGVAFDLEGVGSLGEIMNTMMSGGIHQMTRPHQNEEVEIIEEITEPVSLDDQVKEELQDLNV